MQRPASGYTGLHSQTTAQPQLRISEDILHTWYGLSGCTMRVLPGVRLSSMPPMTTTKRSVVGSGPMWMPGYSLPSRCLMNVVFPAPCHRRF